MKAKLITCTLILAIIMTSSIAVALEKGDVVGLRIGEDIHKNYDYRHLAMNFCYAGLINHRTFSIGIRTGDGAYNLYYMVDGDKEFVIRNRYANKDSKIVCKLLGITPKKIVFKILYID